MLEPKSGLPNPLIRHFPENWEGRGGAMQDFLTGCDGRTAAGDREMWREESAERSFWLVVFARLLSACEWVCARAEDVKSTWSGGATKISHQLKVR